MQVKGEPRWFQKRSSSSSSIPSLIKFTFILQHSSSSTALSLLTCQDTVLKMANAKKIDSSNVAPTDNGLQKVGEGVTELIAGIKEVADLGIERSEIPVPKVIVVGDQSAGKSSLIEAITQIQVPRDTGTCTRVCLHTRHFTPKLTIRSVRFISPQHLRKTGGSALSPLCASTMSAPTSHLREQKTRLSHSSPGSRAKIHVNLRSSLASRVETSFKTYFCAPNTRS